jgi:RNA-directed DNA polymerase
VLNHLEWTLMRWACSKFKPLRGRITRAHQWLAGVEGREPQLFVHWQLGITSTARIRRAV